MIAQSARRPADTESGMPHPIDSETAMLLRTVLLPHFEMATSWGDLCNRLEAKGYEITFRAGHLVVVDDHGKAVCTGSMIGLPLSRLADRLGRPRLRTACSGDTATLSS